MPLRNAPCPLEPPKELLESDELWLHLNDIPNVKTQERLAFQRWRAWYLRGEEIASYARSHAEATGESWPGGA